MRDETDLVESLEGGLSGLGWTTPCPIQLKNLDSKSWFNSFESASKCIENLVLLGPQFQFPLPLLFQPWISLLKKLILYATFIRNYLLEQTIHDIS
jgi:hypothetical protein